MTAAPDLGVTDASMTLASIAAVRRGADQLEADLLAYVAHLCDLHPVVDDSDVPAAYRMDDDELMAVGRSLPIAGDGCPEVREDAVHELAAALGTSHHAALALAGETLELRHRLPRLWRLVQDLTLPSWQGRKAAAETIRLSAQAVAFVDTNLAVHARRGRLTLGRVRLVVQLARTKFEPVETRTVEEQVLAQRGVMFETHHQTPVVTHLHATLDTIEAQALDETISDLAVSLGRLGDTTSLDERRATALGMLAHPQAVLDLPASEQRPTQTPTLYVHLDAADLEHGTGGATVERLGAITAEQLGSWLERSGKVRLQPVLDMSRADAVDRHDPPEWMHTLVVLRDQHCVFPGCRTDARSCDLDHLVPYAEHGPPGQTHPANLAPLCRRHHNRKTHHGWRYDRTAAGYAWTSPLGRQYLVPHLT